MIKVAETPVLTKKQQKSSLSAKKTKTKETIRNVLATPYTKYWPVISNDHFGLLHEAISKHLPKISQEKARIPWNELKQIPKSERKLFRTQKQTSGMNEKNTDDRQGLTFGVNDTARALEKGIIKSILITEDVQPKLMVEHLIDQCVLFRIPVLVVPGLRSVLLKICGLSSITIAFTDTAKYNIIQETIDNIYKHYPVPRGHVNFKRSLNLLNVPVIVVNDSIIDDSAAQEVTGTAEIEPPTNFYLYRKTTKERIFIPEKSNNQIKSNNGLQVDSTGFLAFSVDPPETTTKHYKSLSVKRVKGDINRSQRKIEQMKKSSNRKRKGKNK